VKPPAKEGDRVVEDDKDQTLYVVTVTPDRIGMAYRPGGTEAVRATWSDFLLFFHVSQVKALTVAAKKLKDKHVRVLTTFNTNGRDFRTNEIVVVTGAYRNGIHVRAEDGRVAYRVPVSYFELAE
jgi:hypothetical protein